MVRKRLIRLGMSVAALALALVVASPVASYAANTSPTSYFFNFSVSDPVGTVDHTYFRPKIDNTVAYAKADAYNSAFYVGVAGINGYTLAYTNRTINTVAYFRAVNQASSIRNTVNESGEYAAWFWIYKTVAHSTYLDGEWAPDSVALYTVINDGF